MSIDTAGFGPGFQVHHDSDIQSLHWVDGALRVVIARELGADGRVHGIEIRFAKASGLRLLDEADLARYWVSDGFVRGYHVLEVLGGGWAGEQAVVEGHERQRREWLLVTGNGCASVFADAPPDITETTWTKTE